MPHHNDDNEPGRRTSITLMDLRKCFREGGIEHNVRNKPFPRDEHLSKLFYWLDRFLQTQAEAVKIQREMSDLKRIHELNVEIDQHARALRASLLVSNPLLQSNGVPAASLSLRRRALLAVNALVEEQAFADLPETEGAMWVPFAAVAMRLVSDSLLSAGWRKPPKDKCAAVVAHIIALVFPAVAVTGETVEREVNRRSQWWEKSRGKIVRDVPG